MVVEEVELISISAYADVWKITRKTVYDLIEDGRLIRYSAPDGKPLLNKNQPPVGVKAYGNREEPIDKASKPE